MKEPVQYYEMSFEEKILKIFKILLKFRWQLDLFGFGIPSFFKYPCIIRFTVRNLDDNWTYSVLAYHPFLSILALYALLWDITITAFCILYTQSWKNTFENTTLCNKIMSQLSVTIKHHSALKHKSSPQEFLCYCSTIIVRVITVAVSVITIFNS